MKSNTRVIILQIIQRREGARPIEIVQELGLTPQAIHRHLRSLVIAGQIEAVGRGPRTFYRMAGKPQLLPAFHWVSSEGTPKHNPKDLICETRDVFSARLNHLLPLVKHGLKNEELPLVISVTGEIGNNCFDHNMGKWRDIPGCWYETQMTGGLLWICIADRGQGIYQSLVRVDSQIMGDQEALQTAFEKNISGRAPENRGNGLKFVRNIIVQGEHRGLACRSGVGIVDYGSWGPLCRQQLMGSPSPVKGTMTLMVWGLK